MFERLGRERLYKGVVHQITQSIQTGQLKAGDQLPTEIELTKQFGVSRTAVREAIKALTSQGLVNVEPGRGSFITVPPIETVSSALLLMFRLENHSHDDLLEARRFLEVPIARLAANAAQPENLQTLATDLRGMIDVQTNPEAFVRYDSEFHAELARATQNLVLSMLIQPIILMFVAGREIAARLPDVPERAIAHHKRIYEAIVNKDAEAAENAMRDHLDQATKDMFRARQIGPFRSTRGV